MAECPPKLPRPIMKGLLARDTKITIISAIAIGLVGGALFKVFVADARKRKYAEFYKTYDAEEDFKRMKALGLFQSG